MFKLVVLCSLLAAASACQWAPQPGTTITTVTTTTTTSNADGSGLGGLLNSGDRDAIRGSWERAKRNGAIAPAVLLKFIQAHPEYQKKFSAFADVPMDKLAKNGNFLAQAFTIMAGMNVIVQSLGSQELLAAEMAHLGKTHFERGVSVAMFEEFGRVIVDVLDEKVPLNDQERHSWENGLTALVASVAKSLKPKEDVAHPLTQLTPHQISDVKRTWTNLRGDRNNIVSKIFMSLFQRDSSLQSKFAAFAAVPMTNLVSDAAFNEQVALVADRLDAMIEDLDTPLQLGGQIRYMAFSHKPRGILRQEFRAFADLLMESLAAKGVTTDDLDSWRGVLNTMVNKIAKIQSM